MQRLSMIALAAIAVLALSGAGFTSKPATARTLASASASTPNPSPTTKTPTAFAANYYFYSMIYGTYNDYNNVAQEIYEMEMAWGCPVDQNGLNGTLLEEGFTINNPNYPVMIWLYGHF